MFSFPALLLTLCGTVVAAAALRGIRPEYGLGAKAVRRPAELLDMSRGDFRRVSVIKRRSSDVELSRYHHESLETDTANVSNTDVYTFDAPVVKVEGVPEYLVVPRESIKNITTSLTVTCSGQGFPIPSIVWEYLECPKGRSSCPDFHDSENIEKFLIGEVLYNNLGPRNITSTVNLTLKESGLLRCLATNRQGSGEQIVPVTITDIDNLHDFTYTSNDAKKYITIPAGFTVTENDAIMLYCYANKFHFKGVQLQTSGGGLNEVLIHNTDYTWGVLAIREWKVTKTMAGNYSCVAERHNGTKEAKDITMNVIGEENVTFPADSKMVTGEPETAEEGLPYIINCTVFGRPRPTIAWFKNDKPLSPDSEFFDNTTVFLSDDRQLLHLKHVSQEHIGVYRCEAQNRVSFNKGKLILGLPDKMPIHFRKDVNMLGSDEIIVAENASFVLNCSATGIPPPNVTWKKNDKQLSPDSEFFNNTTVLLSDDRQLLHLKHVSQEHIGVYRCEAQNEVNSVTGTLSLTLPVPLSVDVMDVPPFVIVHFVAAERSWIYPDIQAKCSAKGVPRPSITWEFKKCENLSSSCSEFELIKTGHVPLNFRQKKDEAISVLVKKFTSSGYLRCLATNSFYTDNETVPIALSDSNGLHIMQYNNNDQPIVNVTVNDDFQPIVCSAHKLFYKEARLITPPSYDGKESKTWSNDYFWKDEIYSNGKQFVSRSMEGNYSCLAIRHNNTKEMKNITINVFDQVPVRFLHDSNMKNTKGVAETNKPYYMNCSVFGRPTPNITWMKDGRSLSHNSDLFDNRTAKLSVDLQLLSLLRPLKEQHDGVYTCTATNRVNTVTGTHVLSVTAGEHSKTSVGAILGGFLGFAIVFIFTVILMTKRMKQERRRFKRILTQREIDHFRKGSTAQLNEDRPAYQQIESLPYSQKWEVPKKHIEEGLFLGTGAFGRVVKATVTGLEKRGIKTVIALKTCKNQRDTSQVRALLLELKIMSHMGSHLNIVNLLGANTEHIKRGEVMILMEYCLFGDLVAFMHQHAKNFINLVQRRSGHIDFNLLPSVETISQVDSHGMPSEFEVGSVPGINKLFSTKDLVCWAWQVAHGMDYLTNRKVLHGDLAARNLLIAKDNVIKIADFGMSREMCNDYYKKSDTEEALPQRWMSVEAIRDRIFSVQSDVWSYGVTLWEIFTLGSRPYPDIEDQDLLQRLQNGHRMSHPKYASNQIYRLMWECWVCEPSDRPSFGQLVERLDRMMDPRIKQDLLKMNAEYLKMNEERFRDETDYVKKLSNVEYKKVKSQHVNSEVVDVTTEETEDQELGIESPEVVSYKNMTSSLPTSDSLTHRPLHPYMSA